MNHNIKCLLAQTIQIIDQSDAQTKTWFFSNKTLDGLDICVRYDANVMLKYTYGEI